MCSFYLSHNLYAVILIHLFHPLSILAIFWPYYPMYTGRISIYSCTPSNFLVFVILGNARTRASAVYDLLYIIYSDSE